VVDWDPRLADRLGTEDRDVSGLAFDEAFPALADSTVRTLGERVLEAGASDPVDLDVGDEWLQLRAVPAGEGLVWFVRDITERKRYEREMEETRDRLEDPLERITDAFFVLDTDENVTVFVGPTADGFAVGDDGPGIPAEERSEVFQQGVTGSEDATGYGLAIVSEIVDGHGWSIEATESSAGGACFEVHHIHSLAEADEETA
jgi:signal transduction histidine kinase